MIFMDVSVSNRFHELKVIFFQILQAFECLPYPDELRSVHPKKKEPIKIITIIANVFLLQFIKKSKKIAFSLID